MDYTTESQIKQVGYSEKSGVQESLLLPSGLFGFHNTATTVEQTKSGRDVLVLYGELSVRPADSVCQKCGRKMHVHGNYPTCLRHLNFGGKLSCVCFEKSRYYCPACRHSQMQGIPFKAENHNITRELEQYARDLLAYTQYYEDYKQYMGIKAISEEAVQQVPECFHTIEFRNVSFQYRGQTTYALRNVNLKIHAGDKILLVGENGAGKSTLVKLLLRIYKPTEGVILMDGVDIQDFSFAEYTQLFSTVFQDYKLFSFSLKDNIVLDRRENEARIYEILQDTGMKAKIDTLPHGLNTFVYREFDDEGYTPSGGEGQRLAMCRAVYNSSSIVILDEPTAALDPKTENELYQMFDSLFPNQTAFYISHRMASAKLCNRILVLQNGEVAEDGTHEELIQQKGIYAKFFQLQADSYQI